MELSLLQWNVWIFEKKENILKLLGEFNPDVICLQELTSNSTNQQGADVAEYLAKELGYNQFHKMIPNLAPSDGIGDLANGILTRYPIRSSNWKWVQEPQHGGSTYDDQYRLYVEAVIDVGGRSITFGTTHLSYTHKFKASQQKEKEADNLIAIASKKASNYILTGDFNALPDSNLVKNMQKRLKHAGPDFNVNTWTTKPFSYNGFEADQLKYRLDYTFVTNDIKVLTSEVLSTDFSDHLPILTRINLNV